MSGGGSNAVAPSTQNVVQTSSPPPQFLQAYENIVNQAEGVASQPLQQYPGQIVAPLNSTQQQAFGDIQNAQGQAQPYINAAGQYFGAATQPLWNGVPQLDPSQISGAANNGIGYVNQAAGADISGAGASGIAAANNYAGTNIGAAGQPGINSAYAAQGTGINRAVTGANTNIGAAGQQGINAAYAGANTNIQAAGQPGINAAYAGANTDIGAAGQPGINAAMGAAYTNPNAVSSYLSPYIQNVVDTTQAQFNNQNAQNRNALAGKEVSEGAWGGDRNGVAAAELQNQEDLAQAPVIAGLQNTGYQSAMTALQQQEALEASTGISAAGLGQSAAQQRAALQESAGISAAGLGQSAAQEEGQLQSTTGIAAAGLGQTAAQQEAALQTQEGLGEAGLGAQTGISAAGLAQSGAQAGATLGAQTNLTGAQLSQTAAQQEAALQAGAGTQDLGLFTGQQGAELGADEANSWLNSQAGFGQAALGTEAQNTNLQDISTLLQSGGLQQAQTQQELNVPYEQFQQEQAYPFQTTNFLAGIAEGTGSAAGGTSSSTSTTNPSTLSTVAGIGEAGLGLNQLGAFDGLFGSGSSGLTDNSNLSSYASGIGNALSPGFGLTPDLSSLGDLFAKGGAVKRDFGGSIPKTGADDFFLPGLDDIPDVSASYVPNTKPVVGMGPPKPPEIPRQQASGSSSGGGDSTVSDLMSLAKIGLTIASFLNRGGSVQKRDLGGGIGDFLDSGSLGLVPQFWNSGKGSDIEKILGLGGIAAGGGGGSSDMLKGLLGGGIGMLGLKDGGIAGDNDNHAPYPERRTGTHGGIAGHYDDGGDILDGPPPMPTPRPDLPTDTRAGMDAVTSQPTGIAAAAPVAPPAQNRYMPDYTPPAAPARSPSDNSTDYRKNAAGMALLTAGLGTLATGNIGRGGLEGVKSYQDQLKQASDIDEKQQTESDTGQYRLASMKQEGLRLSDAADEAKARLAQQDKTFGLDQQKFGEDQRHNKADEANAAATRGIAAEKEADEHRLMTTPMDANGNPVLNDPVTTSWVENVKSGNATMQQVPAALRNRVSMALQAVPGTDFSPLAASRLTMASHRISQPFTSLPQYQLTANGLPYLQRIDAALKTPGSVSDQDLLDSLTKLNTAGNAVTDAQVKLVTDGRSLADWGGVIENKIQNGGVLSNNQRQQIHDIANNIYANYRKGYQPVYDQAAAQLTAAGIPKQFWTIPDLNKLNAGQSAIGGAGATAIDPKAIAMLKADPSTAKHFDAIFGAGAAAKILGQ